MKVWNNGALYVNGIPRAEDETIDQIERDCRVGPYAEDEASTYTEDAS